MIAGRESDEPSPYRARHGKVAPKNVEYLWESVHDTEDTHSAAPPQSFSLIHAEIQHDNVSAPRLDARLKIVDSITRRSSTHAAIHDPKSLISPEMRGES